MPGKYEAEFDPSAFVSELERHGTGLGDLPGWMFRDLVLYFDTADHSKPNGATNGAQHNSPDPRDLQFQMACTTARFLGAQIVSDLGDKRITQIVVGRDTSRLRRIREELTRRERIPRIVTFDWIEESWAERTLLDEERFAPS